MKNVATPEVLEELVARLSRLRPDSTRRWGTMTPGEMLCHLADSASMTLSLAGAGRPKSRRLLKWIGLYTPLPWPHGRQTQARADPRREGRRPVDFEQDRQSALEGLRNLASAPDDGFPVSHAVFGTLNAREWKRWVYRHTDYHLKQFGL
jgi:hypothetical protein